MIDYTWGREPEDKAIIHGRPCRRALLSVKAYIKLQPSDACQDLRCICFTKPGRVVAKGERPTRRFAGSSLTFGFLSFFLKSCSLDTLCSLLSFSTFRLGFLCTLAPCSAVWSEFPTWIETLTVFFREHYVCRSFPVANWYRTSWQGCAGCIYV